jgi:DNA-binding FadR family transcriptional regulator
MAKRPAVSKLVQEYIRDYIVTNKLGPGDPLPSEGQIAAALEVSRISAREGVKVLETLGILEVRHGNGLFVRGLNLDALLDVLSHTILFDLSSLKDLYQVRKLFETAMIAEVIQNIQDEDIATCRKHLQQWEQNVAQGKPFHEQDRLFHLSLCKAIGNKLMLELENIFWIAYRNAEERLDFPQVFKKDYPLVLQAHTALLDAVEARDTALAQQLMEQSFADFKKRWELMEQHQSNHEDKKDDEDDSSIAI